MITGALGCIGSWVLRELCREGAQVVAADVSQDFYRVRLLVPENQLSRVRFVRCDVTDDTHVQGLICEEGITHVIHLAALQVPSCQANPPLGAHVNVTGTAKIFEVVRQSGTQIRGFCYASSIAVLGPPSIYDHAPVPDSALRFPGTLYGIYKKANEDMAKIYWNDWHVPSVGLRPYVVFGAGRDQGMTSDVTKAVQACAAGESFHIQFDGPVVLQYAADIARMFIQSVRAEYRGAACCNIRHQATTVDQFVALLKGMFPRCRVTHKKGRTLPFPSNLDDSGLRSIIGEIARTPLTQATQETYDHFRRLLSETNPRPL